MKFIKVSETDYINLDHVTEIQKRKTKETFSLLVTFGKTHTITVKHPFSVAVEDAILSTP